jgi:hypothetical protein
VTFQTATTTDDEFVPGTVNELTRWINERYHCMPGPPRAYFEFPIDFNTDERGRALYANVYFHRVGRRDDVERELVLGLWHMFHDAYVNLQGRGFDQPLLYWRRIPTIEENRDIETLRSTTTLSCRVWVPGIDLSPFDRDGRKCG